VVVESWRGGFGSVDDDRVITYPFGLVGFDGPLRYAVIDDGEDLRLQCMNDTELAFTVIIPWERFPDYEPVLPLEDQLALGLEHEQDALVLCLLAGAADRPTVNLMAPLVVNRHTGLGRQVVLFDSAWPVRARLAS